MAESGHALDIRVIWDEVLDALGVTRSTQRDQAFQSLVSAYREPHRHYHNLAHISNVLSVLLMHETEIIDRKALLLAAMYHDVVYDPKSNENEQRSAEYATKTLREFALPAELIERIEQLILFTKNHSASADDSDSLLLLDADLTVLASTTVVYDEYRDAIRKEYSWVADREFFSGRRNVLARFLTRPSIFHSPHYPHWEVRARANIAREIAEIDARLRTLA